MKRLRPNQQQVASLLKAFSPYSGAALLLLGLAAAFVAYSTHEQPLTAVEGAANNQVTLAEEAPQAETPLGTPSSFGPVGPTKPDSESSYAATQQRDMDRSVAKVPKPVPRKSENAPPVPQTQLSGRASVSSLAVYSVAKLIQQYVRNPQSTAKANAKVASFGQRLGADVLDKFAFTQEEQGESLLSELNTLVAPPAQTTTNETLPAGTLIIAMDEALQGGSNARVRDAYGLAVHLLHADVPLKWIIKPNKTSRTAVDFSASARRKFPTTSSFSNRSFRTGPIAIFPGFEAEAQTVINSFGNGIRVYELQNATTVPVNSDLTHKPKVLVEQQQNPGIHTSILSAAELDQGTHYYTDNLTTVNANSCVTIITVPHNDAIDPSQRNAVKDFTRNGGNFFAQCAAVRGFQKFNPRVFTSAGFRDNPGIGSFQYDNPSEPSAQFEGNVFDEGGSLEDFGFNTNPPGGTRIIHDNNNDYKAYTGRIDGFNASAGGYVHYFGGHDHGGDIDADRYYLNAVLRSADRPSSCGLTIATVAANDDTGQIDCGTDFIDINVLANDQDLTGTGGLSIQNLTPGPNPQGTFAVVSGQVRYTPDNSGSWSGPVTATYQACNSNNLCDQATITITSSTPNSSVIAGTVFEDSNENGTQDAGDPGQSGVTVRLYEDNNGNGVIDSGEPVVQTQTTNANGDYSFSVSSFPTSSGNTTVTSSKATSAYSGDGSEGYGSCNVMYVEDYPSYSYVEFNLSTAVPSGCSVTSASLELRQSYGGSSDLGFQIRKVLQSWSEGNGGCYPSGNNSGLTWNNRPNLASTVYASGTLMDNQSLYTLNVTNLVDEWVSGASTNYGLAVINSGSGSEFGLHSDDASSSLRPKLEINYTCPTSVEYVVEVDETTLPSNATLTTAGTSAVELTGLGQLDCNNDFGFNNESVPVANNDGEIALGQNVLIAYMPWEGYNY
ncbi:MAG: DNRLRE domain-containing protein, partial [Bacteroidetes bacterium]|nr:DNRLRE domain-containing protein [Bacteroidota bacterium]